MTTYTKTIYFVIIGAHFAIIH